MLDQKDWHVGEHVEQLGYRFTITNDHPTPAELVQWRTVGDPLADAVVDEVIATDPKIDLVQYMRSQKTLACKAMYASLDTVPAWVDWSQVERGRCVMMTYPVPVRLSLLNLSLIGLYVCSSINKVLNTTAYLTSKNLFTSYVRLRETLEWVTETFMVDANKPWRDGMVASTRVRFLHAKVRHRLAKSSKFDSAVDGVPINQEDLAFTLLAFSIQVLNGIERCGFTISQADKEAEIHFWRVVGWQMGITDKSNICTSYRNAQLYFESMLLHMCHKTGTVDTVSHRLTDNSVRSLAEYQVPERYLGMPVKLTYFAYSTLARQMMPKEQADVLGIAPPTDGSVFEYWSTVAALYFLIGYTYLTCLVQQLPGMRDRVLAYNLQSQVDFVELQLEGKKQTYAKAERELTTE